MFRLPCFMVGMAALALGKPVQGSVFWDESVSGDLSSIQSAPNTFTLSSGVNSVIGTVGGGTDLQDWITLTILNGLQLSALTLALYPTPDQAFLAFQSGSVIAGSAFLPSSYAGYSHFGPQMVGQDLLLAMPQPDATGFTSPLSAGTYAFLIQQFDSQTMYQLDYSVTAVPEISSQMAAGITCALLFLKRRWSCSFKTA